MPGLSLNLRAALAALRAHRLRTALSLLGIFIAVAAIIFTATISKVAEDAARSSLETFGGRTLLIWSSDGRNGERALTLRDARILSRIAGVQLASPQLRRDAMATAGNRSARLSVVGFDPAHAEALNIVPASGRPLTPADDRRAAGVLLLSIDAAERLFGTSTAEGRRIRLNESLFDVVGTVTGGIGGREGTAFMALGTARRRIVGDESGQRADLIVVKAAAAADIGVVERQARAALRDSFRVRTGEPDPFALTNTADLAREGDALLFTQRASLLGIASIGLLVGAIGVANIMLVAVSERTREIGIRMAVGATPADIRGQFLTEALLLCLIGAALGSGTGLLLSLFLLWLLDAPLVVPWSAMVIGCATSLLAGLAAGYGPAVRASRMLPTAALNRE